MKKIILASAMVVSVVASLPAMAQTLICGGNAAGAGTAPAAGTAGTNYMVRAIKPQCSANVFVSGQDGTNGAWYAVGSASVKGKTTFKGSTEGGAVTKNADCAKAGGCTQTEAETARTQANTDATALASSS